MALNLSLQKQLKNATLNQELAARPNDRRRLPREPLTKGARGFFAGIESSEPRPLGHREIGTVRQADLTAAIADVRQAIAELARRRERLARLTHLALEPPSSVHEPFPRQEGCRHDLPPTRNSATHSGSTPSTRQILTTSR